MWCLENWDRCRAAILAPFVPQPQGGATSGEKNVPKRAGKRCTSNATFTQVNVKQFLYLYTCKHPYMQTCKHACMHTAYVHTYIDIDYCAPMCCLQDNISIYIYIVSLTWHNSTTGLVARFITCWPRPWSAGGRWPRAAALWPRLSCCLSEGVAPARSQAQKCDTLRRHVEM